MQDQKLNLAEGSKVINEVIYVVCCVAKVVFITDLPFLTPKMMRKESLTLRDFSCVPHCETSEKVGYPSQI